MSDLQGSQDVAVSVRHLTKEYKIFGKPSDMFWELVTRKPRHTVFRALDDVSFDIPFGEVVGIIGRNGAGKSTLLKILSRTLDATRGEFDVHGKLSAILELGTGFHPDYTGRENIRMGGLCLGMTGSEIEEKMDSIIEFSELAHVIDQPFKTYSSGMQARLTFSTAMSVEPDIFIVDEALATGDVLFQEKCLRRIREICSGGTTVLLVTHSLHHIYEVCTHCLLLSNSKLVAQGGTREIGEQYERLIADERRSEKATHVAISANGETNKADSPRRNRDIALTDSGVQSVSESPVDGEALSNFERPLTIGKTRNAGTSATGHHTDTAGLIDPPSAEEVSQSPSESSSVESQSTQEAEVAFLDLQNANGDAVTTLCIDRDYRVVVRVRFHADVIRPNIGFRVQRETGLVLFGDTTLEKGFEFEGKAGTEATATFEFTCRCLSGVYLLGGGVVSVDDAGNITPLHMVRGETAFIVEGRRLNGLMDPCSTIRVETESGEVNRQEAA